MTAGFWQRTVVVGLMSYIDERGAYRTATAGAVVKVNEDQIERFDRLNVLAAPMSSTALLDIKDFMDPEIRHVDDIEIEEPDNGAPTEYAMAGEMKVDPDAPVVVYSDGGPVESPQAEPEPSDAWTVPRLQEYAAAKEIDLGDATKKADILAAIQAGRES
jgi:hypothetical protein